MRPPGCTEQPRSALAHGARGGGGSRHKSFSSLKTVRRKHGLYARQFFKDEAMPASPKATAE